MFLLLFISFLVIPDGMLDIDADSRQLYWASSFSGTIGVADMDGNNSRVLYESDNGGSSVVDIRVDPDEGLVYSVPKKQLTSELIRS